MSYKGHTDVATMKIDTNTFNDTGKQLSTVFSLTWVENRCERAKKILLSLLFEVALNSCKSFNDLGDGCFGMIHTLHMDIQ